MKKNCVVLFFCLLALPILSQVTNIQSISNRFELVGEHIMYDTQTNVYDLVVRSSNQFENKAAYISLGKTQTEILTSFKNLGAALQKTKTNFTVAGYTIYVLDSPGDAYISNNGKLAHTAGIYHFTSPLLGRALLDLAKEKNWSIDNYEIKVSIWEYSAYFDVILNDFYLNDYINLTLSDYAVQCSDWFNVNEGDVLKAWQIAIIKSKIDDGIIENDDNAKRFQFLTTEINVEKELKNAPQQQNSSKVDTPAYRGNCTEDGEIFMVVEKMPEFPNGQAAMFKFLNDNLQYPKEADDGSQGRAICQFVINTDGTICDIEILRSTGSKPLDAEAIRLIQNMPIWIPGMQNGKKVRVKYTVPINFRPTY